MSNKVIDAQAAIKTLREVAIACRLTGMKANLKEEDVTDLADLIERDVADITRLNAALSSEKRYAAALADELSALMQRDGEVKR